LSIISDECYPETLTPINIQDIIDTAAKTEQTLTFLLKKAVAQL